MIGDPLLTRTSAHLISESLLWSLAGGWRYGAKVSLLEDALGACRTDDEVKDYLARRHAMAIDEHRAARHQLVALWDLPALTRKLRDVRSARQHLEVTAELSRHVSSCFAGRIAHGRI